MKSKKYLKKFALKISLDCSDAINKPGKHAEDFRLTSILELKNINNKQHVHVYP